MGLFLFGWDEISTRGDGWLGTKPPAPWQHNYLDVEGGEGFECQQETCLYLMEGRASVGKHNSRPVWLGTKIECMTYCTLSVVRLDIDGHQQQCATGLYIII